MVRAKYMNEHRCIALLYKNSKEQRLPVQVIYALKMLK